MIFKNPSVFQLEFERKQLVKIGEEARRMFAAISDRDKNKWAYVYAPEGEFVGIMENSLPSFWTPSLSKAYADSTPEQKVILPLMMTPEQKMQKAKELYRMNWSCSEIKRYFGVSKSTVYNWIHDYPYRRRRVF